MSRVTLQGKVLRWGNSFGIRLRRKDMEDLQLRPGADIAVQIDVAEPALDPTKARTFRLGGNAADDHDELYAKSASEDNP